MSREDQQTDALIAPAYALKRLGSDFFSVCVRPDHG